MSATEVDEISFPKPVLMDKIRAREASINLRLVMLLGLLANDDMQAGWRQEILVDTGYLSGLRVRIDDRVRQLRAVNFFNILYRQPFERNEQPYASGLIGQALMNAELIGRPMQRNARSLADIVAHLRGIHHGLATALHVGNDGVALILKVGSFPSR